MAGPAGSRRAGRCVSRTSLCTSECSLRIRAYLPPASSAHPGHPDSISPGGFFVLFPVPETEKAAPGGLLGGVVGGGSGKQSPQLLGGLNPAFLGDSRFPWGLTQPPSSPLGVSHPLKHMPEWPRAASSAALLPLLSATFPGLWKHHKVESTTQCPSGEDGFGALPRSECTFLPSVTTALKHTPEGGWQGALCLYPQLGHLKLL